MKYKFYDNKLKSIDGTIKINGYKLPSRKKYFKIEDTKVTNIIITNKRLAHPFISKIVRKKYEKLINSLTEILVSDDETGRSSMQVLNMIEKFKIEIKNKYRKYLRRKELSEMASKLKFIEKEAMKKQITLNNFYMNMENTNNRRR